MTFELPPLPYPKNALEPHISERTLEFHHGKHHKTYVETLNKLIENTPFTAKSLEEIIKITYEDDSKTKIFNNAAQVWNHTFFWHSMKPQGGGKPSETIAKRIDQDFGGFDKFKAEFKQAGVDQFGSGWAWLVLDKNKLKIIKTANAVDPLALGQTALLTCDVWEHAYYLDYQNRRADFLEVFLNSLANWDFVAQNLEKAKAHV